MEVIEVRNVQFYGFKRIDYQAGEFSLKIGDIFDLKGIKISFSPIQKKIFLRSFPNGVSLNRFSEIWLREVISQFCAKEAVNLSSFLDQIGQSEDFLNPPPFIPEGWEEDPLAIYIDYIELRNIQCEHGKENLIRATIVIGDHVTFSSVPIYDPTKESYLEPKLVNNETVTDCINRLIKSEKAKREIQMVCAVGQHISTDYMDREKL